MWTIDKPLIGALENFETCIEGVRPGDLKNRLSEIKDDIDVGGAIFEQSASTSSLFEIEASDLVGTVTAGEMANLYDRHMARSGSRGRDTYDKLMIAAEHDQCPFCGHRIVSTLDHSLPKANHPLFAVTPVNLVPCCKDCNHAKGTQTATAEEEQLLHPYYDDVTADRWLFAEIVRGRPPGAIFRVVSPNDWSDSIAARVALQFDTLKLAQLYASQAGRQLQNMRRALVEILEGADPAAVKRELERRARSCADVAVNSWEGALYEAAAESEWYCAGGFQG